MRSKNMEQSINEFRIGHTQLSYAKLHYQFLIEVYVLDVYRSHLLKRGDVVLDLGAGIGDFSILASQKVGSSGKVIAIEPDQDDFALLEANILKNKCNNIIALNVGVANAEGSRTMSFRGRDYSFQVNTLHNILQNLELHNKIDFVKMDIEGYEKEVISDGVDEIKCVKAISIELHDTRNYVDSLLKPHGFTFIPLSKNYIYSHVLRNMVLHPFLLFHAYSILKQHNPRLLSSVTHGLDYDTNSAYLTGTYINNNKSVRE